MLPTVQSSAMKPQQIHRVYGQVLNTMVCVDVVTDVKLPVQEVVVAADVLRQSEEPPAAPSVTLVNGQLEHGVALQHADTQLNQHWLMLLVSDSCSQPAWSCILCLFCSFVLSVCFFICSSNH